LSRSLAIAASIAACVVTALALGAASVSAAGPQFLGQALPSEAGGCECVAIQFGTDPTAPTGYAIPSDGVITKTQFYIGEFTDGVSEEWVRAGTYRRAGANATETARGAKHPVNGLAKGLHEYLERIPAAAGDLLGARYRIGGPLDATPRGIETGKPADETGFFVGEPSLGSPFPASPFTSFRANVAAVLEPDDDSDEYGDSSQDLCLGSPIGAGACSGALLGSNLQGERDFVGNCALFTDCLRVQTQLNGSSTAAPFDGVVVRWRVLNGKTGNYAVKVLSPNGGGSYTVLRSSASESVTAPASPAFSQISSFPTRLPIPAGDYVGLVVPNGLTQGFQASPGGASKYAQASDGGEGATIAGVSLNGTILYDADVEPDADHDGYGDVTQDSCPQASSVHDGTCPLKEDIPPPPPPKLRAKTPKIAAVKRDKKGRYEVKVKVQQAGTITAQLTGKLKPKAKATKLGRAVTKRAAKAGAYTLTLKPPKAARALKVKAKLVVTLAPAGFLPAQASSSFRLR